jgi:protein TonB
VLTAVAVAAAVLSAPATSGLMAQTPAPTVPAAPSQLPPGSATRTIELALEALRQGRMAEAEGLLAQAVATLRRERLATERATPAPVLGQAVRVGGDIAEPKKLRDVKPVYPAIAQAANVSGVVILEAVIDEQGNVANARVLRSIALLDQAALDAVYQWKFVPTLLNGVPTPVIMTVTVNFSLGPR